MNLPLIPIDKANHFIYGFIIFTICQLLLNDYYSFAVVCIFALGKEVRDQIVYKGFDYKDFLVTILPCIILHFLR